MFLFGTIEANAFLFEEFHFFTALAGVRTAGLILVLRSALLILILAPAVPGLVRRVRFWWPVRLKRHASSHSLVNLLIRKVFLSELLEHAILHFLTADASEKSHDQKFVICKVMQISDQGQLFD